MEISQRPKLELILPMMLQIENVFSRFTAAMAILYWIDWAVVRYYHCWVCFVPVTDEKSRCRHTGQEIDAGDSICAGDSDT